MTEGRDHLTMTEIDLLMMIEIREEEYDKFYFAKYDNDTNVKIEFILCGEIIWGEVSILLWTFVFPIIF